ncbi:acyltransferase domain-containing protein [Kitasatospora acidiphila]|uniref:Acyltransferase domain-containing protein n=1 Tax=Kitasatospora acidiphila TaxID=2567942 RepID=A0A540WGR8_9ACTN|nr:acyltransferase domain-containing protein [Kitasatospora acidiphila]
MLSLEDACALVVARGRLMQALPAGGAMVAVGGSEDVVRAVVDGVEGVWLAAVNGPSSVVLSGLEEPVLAAAAKLAELGCRTRHLTVSHAFHSGLMDPMLREFADVVAGLDLREPMLPLVSTVTGRVESELWTQPQYWVRQVRDAVRFADGVAAMLDLGVGSFVEVGPDAVLSGMVAECLPRTARPAAWCRPCARDVTRSVAWWRRWRACTPPAPRSPGTRCSRAPAPAGSTCPPTPSNAAATGRRHPAQEPRTRPAWDWRPPPTRCSVRRSRSRTATSSSSPAASPFRLTPGWPTTPCSVPSSCPRPDSWSLPSVPATRSAQLSSRS